MVQMGPIFQRPLYLLTELGFRVYPNPHYQFTPIPCQSVCIYKGAITTDHFSRYRHDLDESLKVGAEILVLTAVVVVRLYSSKPSQTQRHENIP